MPEYGARGCEHFFFEATKALRCDIYFTFYLPRVYREHFCYFLLQVTTALMRKKSIARSLRTPENTGPSTADATTKNSPTGELTQVLMLDSGNPNTKTVN